MKTRLVSPILCISSHELEVTNAGFLDLMNVWLWVQRQSDHFCLWSDVLTRSTGVLAELLLVRDRQNISPISWVSKEIQLSKVKNFVPDQVRTLL